MTEPANRLWSLALGLSLTGVVMGLLTSLVGLPQAVEPGVWIGFYVLWGVAILRTGTPPFVTALLASVLSGVWTGCVQIALADAYVANNPWYADQVAEAGGLQPVAVLLFGVGMGVAWGLLVGVVLWAIARARTRRGEVSRTGS